MNKKTKKQKLDELCNWVKKFCEDHFENGPKLKGQDWVELTVFAKQCQENIEHETDPDFEKT